MLESFRSSISLGDGDPADGNDEELLAADLRVVLRLQACSNFELKRTPTRRRYFLKADARTANVWIAPSSLSCKRL